MESARTNIKQLLAQLDAHMRKESYALVTRENYGYFANRFLMYLDKRHIAVEAATEDDVKRHLRFELRRFCRRRGVIPAVPESWCRAPGQGIRMLLRVVRGHWPPTKTPTTQLEASHHRIRHEYAEWLTTFRGLNMRTIASLCDEAGRFMTWFGEQSNPDRMEKLSGNVIDAYMAYRLPPLSRRTKELMAYSMRCFLRYLHSTGHIGQDLTQFIIVPKVYDFETIPSALREEEVRTIIETVRQDRSAMGLRDYAILLLLTTYGLRNGEIIRLRLEDVDWHNNKLYIRRSKSHIESCLPLISAVGEAILEYLRNGRPKTSVREIFIRSVSPYRPLATLYSAIQGRLKEANVHPAGKHGAHAFRHARAVGLLRAGASIKQIGDVLGHRLASTTMIYLKLATEDLRAVALDIPGEANPS